MSLTLSNVQLQEMWHRWREGVQPWADLADTKRYSLPSALAPAGRRALRNLDRFQSNYAFVALVFTVAAILLTPILLFVLALCLAACYTIMRRGPDSRLCIGNVELSAQHQYLSVVGLSVLLLWLLGAGATVSWFVGVLTLLTLVHALVYNSDELSRTADLMEHV